MGKHGDFARFDINQKEADCAIHQGIVLFLFKGDKPDLSPLPILTLNRGKLVIRSSFAHLYIGKLMGFFLADGHFRLLSARRIFISITRFLLKGLFFTSCCIVMKACEDLVLGEWRSFQHFSATFGGYAQRFSEKANDKRIASGEHE
jgi:hypothetical protein